MLNPPQACQAVKAVLEIAEEERGGTPKYNSFHVYKTLEILARGSPRGRPTLVRELSLGEAPVKTLLQRLEEKGLAVKTSRGHTLTNTGWGTLRNIRELVVIADPPASPLEDPKALASPLVKPPKSLVEVYNIRDYIVREMCRISLIGGVESGVPHYPGAPEDVISQVTGWTPGIEDGVIIIVPGKCIDKAFTGLLKLILEEYC